MILLWFAFGWPADVAPPPLYTASGYTMQVDLWRATIDNILVEDISESLVGGYVDMNLDRDIKSAGQLTIRDPLQVTPYSDFLAIFIRLTYDDGRDEVYQQIGLYQVPPPPEKFTAEDAVGTFELRDLTAVLARWTYTATTNFAAASNYATGIRATISAGGISRTNVPDTTSVTAAATSWPPGTNRLQKLNDIIDQIGWYHLGMDLDGKVGTIGASQPLTNMEPWRVITDEDLLSPPDLQPAGDEIANVIVVINDDPSAAPLTSTARNDDPNSPTSTVGPDDGGIGIGYEISPPKPYSVSGTTTQAALDVLAARLLAEARTFYQVVRISLLHDPTALVLHQALDLQLTGEMQGLSGRYWIRTARLGLTPDQPLELEVNRITDSYAGTVI